MTNKNLAGSKELSFATSGFPKWPARTLMINTATRVFGCSLFDCPWLAKRAGTIATTNPTLCGLALAIRAISEQENRNGTQLAKSCANG